MFGCWAVRAASLAKMLKGSQLELSMYVRRGEGIAKEMDLELGKE